MSEPDRLSRTGKSAGSPSPDEPAFLLVGKLHRPHGLRGDILMGVVTDFPERLRPGSVVYIGSGYRPLRIRSCRWHRKYLLVAFDEHVDRESVEGLRNQPVFVRTEERPDLPEGDYYHHQLIGLQVMADDGRLLGTIQEILETGANDVLVVRSAEGTEILLPVIDEVILEIDLERGVLRAHVLSGLDA